ncbi:MAG: LysE family transporter [Ruminiclostridium sp.]|nr:LysE family transporter [Ruminiclostridium sp.]
MFSVILSYLPYSLVTTFTPGPNNILSFYSISQKGWRRGWPIVVGIVAGFFCVMALCALFCYELDQHLPSITNLLKYAGILYILWLAFHVARSNPTEEGGQQASFWKGFFLQFVNVKIILYAITIYTGYVLPAGAAWPDLMAQALVLTCIGATGITTWGAVGGLLQSFLAKHYKPFNYLMAAILVLCAWGML